MRGAAPLVYLVTLVYELLSRLGPYLNSLLQGRILAIPLTPENFIALVSQGYDPLDILAYFGVTPGKVALACLVSILLALAISVISFGYRRYCLGLSRGEPGLGYHTLLCGFQRLSRVLALALLEGVLVLLWSLLLIIPGIIAAYRYSMAYYILMDDPDCTALEAIRRSKAMMSENKASLFVFHLSFLNWALLLIVLTFPLALLTFLMIPSAVLSFMTTLLLSLWLTPFIECSTANFYNVLSGRGLSGREQEPPAPLPPVSPDPWN